MTTSIVVTDWKPMERNTLRGFARVRLPSGMVLHDVAIHQKNGSAWASPASKPTIDRDGAVLKDQNGKVRYTPIIDFTSRETRNRWSDAVIAAVRDAHPEVFDDLDTVAGAS